LRLLKPIAGWSALCLWGLSGGVLPVLAGASQPQAIPIGQGKPETPAPGSGPSPSANTSLQRGRVVYDSYILGPGDSLQIELLDIPELSGTFSIGPDGTLYLPRLRALYVEGLTVEELRYFLTQQFKAYVKNPELYIRPVGYRPVRIYVGGEVKRPGYYTLSGVEAPLLSSSQSNQSSYGNDYVQTTNADGTTSWRPKLTQQQNSTGSENLKGSGAIPVAIVFPKLFDAIRSAEGITPTSNLSAVEVTRKQPIGSGGGKIRTQLNFLSLITQGDESQNIRLFDGDVINIPKSNLVVREQILKAAQTNLNPQFLTVFVSGRVKVPGPVVVPQGATLTQAVIAAGGQKLLHGKVEFVRFTGTGELDRRVFSYNSGAPAEAPQNPILVAGDIINVQDSALSAGLSVFQELAAPLVGVYSIYRITQP
jgi:polysaccharide export outer membrane protein